MNKKQWSNERINYNETKVSNMGIRINNKIQSIEYIITVSCKDKRISIVSGGHFNNKLIGS